jgi:hypothetical protein
MAKMLTAVGLVAGRRLDRRCRWIFVETTLARSVPSILRMVSGLGDERFGVGDDGGYDAAHDAVGAQMADQGAGVDFGQHGNGIALHVLVGDLLGAPVGADGREFADDQALDVGLCRFVVCLVGAVVADLGVGENDDLAGIGGIGGDFLVSGKRSIENNFALAFTWVTIGRGRGRCARLRAPESPASPLRGVDSIDSSRFGATLHEQVSPAARVSKSAGDLID